MEYDANKRKQGGVGGANSNASANLGGVSTPPIRNFTTQATPPTSNTATLPDYPDQFSLAGSSGLPPPTAKKGNGLRAMPFTPTGLKGTGNDLPSMQPSFTRPTNAIYSQRRDEPSVGVQGSGDPADLSKALRSTAPQEGQVNNYPGITELVRNPGVNSLGKLLGSNTQSTVSNLVGAGKWIGDRVSDVGGLLNQARVAASKTDAAQNVGGLIHAAIGDANFPTVNVGDQMHKVRDTSMLESLKSPFQKLGELSRDTANHKPLAPSEIARAETIKDAQIKKAALSNPTSAANSPTNTTPIKAESLDRPISTSESDAAIRAKNMAVLGYTSSAGWNEPTTALNYDERQQMEDMSSLDRALTGRPSYTTSPENVAHFRLGNGPSQSDTPIDASGTPVQPRRNHFDNAYVKEVFGGDVKPNTSSPSTSIGTFQVPQGTAGETVQPPPMSSGRYVDQGLVEANNRVNDYSGFEDRRNYLQGELENAMGKKPGDTGYSGRRIRLLMESLDNVDKAENARFATRSSEDMASNKARLDYQSILDSNNVTKQNKETESKTDLLKTKLGMQKDSAKESLEYDKLNAEQARAALGSIYNPSRDMPLEPSQNLAILKQYTKKPKLDVADITSAYGGKLPEDTDELIKSLSDVGEDPASIENLLKKLKRN